MTCSHMEASAQQQVLGETFSYGCGLHHWQ